MKEGSGGLMEACGDDEGELWMTVWCVNDFVVIGIHCII